MRGPQRPTLVLAAGGHDSQPAFQRGASGGAEPWTLPMGDGAEPLGPARRIAAADPSSRAPLRLGRGLRHVPWPAGAAAATAALVRGCRGRSSAPPAAFVRILGRGRWPVASPRPRAPACPGGPAHAHSVPDHQLPAQMRRRGVGAGPPITRTRETNPRARGLQRRPHPQDEQPLHPAGLGEPAPSAGRTQLGVQSTHCSLAECG